MILPSCGLLPTLLFQVQSGLGISRPSKATLNVQEVQAAAAFLAGVRAFLRCFTLVGLFVQASFQSCWISCSRMCSVVTSFWVALLQAGFTESEPHFLSASKGFGHKEDKQLRIVEGLAGMFLIPFPSSGPAAALPAAAFLVSEGLAAAASRCALMFLMCSVRVIWCGVLESKAYDESHLRKELRTMPVTCGFTLV